MRLKYLRGIDVLREADYDNSQTNEQLAATFDDKSFCEFSRIRFPLHLETHPGMETHENVDMWTMRLMREMQKLVTAAALECRSSLYGPLSLHFLDGKWTMDGLSYHGPDNSHAHMLKWLNECGRRWAVVLVSLHAIESSEKQWDHQIAVVVDLELNCATVFDPNGSGGLPDYPINSDAAHRVQLFEVFVSGAGKLLFPGRKLEWVEPFSKRIDANDWQHWNEGLQAWLDHGHAVHPFWCDSGACGNCSVFKDKDDVSMTIRDPSGLCTAMTAFVYLVCARFGYFDMAHMGVLIREVMSQFVENRPRPLDSARMVLRRRVVDWVMKVYALKDVEQPKRRDALLRELKGNPNLCAVVDYPGGLCDNVPKPSVMHCSKHDKRSPAEHQQEEARQDAGMDLTDRKRKYQHFDQISRAKAVR